MATILVLCVVITAAWVVFTLMAQVNASAPGDTVAGFRRALDALAPADRRRARPAPRARGPARNVAARRRT
ncbi:MAG: hypothetical protein M3N52_01415, partial [Actinomycetota bacterium]|nr:hypothetical protein [Actinomycetota bacterium]